MMIQEFESRTGFYPSQDLYCFIETAYMESKLDKDDFCKAYKENENGMSEAIARKASVTKIIADQKSETEINDKISTLEREIKTLRTQLEKEQEWQPYESDRNVKQADYENLATAGGTRTLTDDEAKQLIADEFGFNPQRITILHSVHKEEINRHRHCRQVGEISREPIYNATDWNYIRFDCVGWCYEMHNGSLKQFYC